MSRQHLVFNNVGSTLVNAITPGQTSFDVVDPVFADPGVDFYTVTAENVSNGAIEIMTVLSVVGATLTVQRGAEGTSPAAFDAGNSIQIRTTAGLIDRLGQKSDLGAMYPFQTTVVTTLLNLYVDPAGSDTTGDGSIGNPWATPYKAVEELQYISFGTTGSAIVNFAAGTYAMDAQLLFNHPQGYRIQLQSAAGFQAVTGMPIGDYSSNRNSPTVPGRGSTEFYNTTGTLGVNASGATRDTNRSSDASNNRTLVKTQNSCVFEWGSAGTDESKFLVVSSLGGFSGIALAFPPADFGLPALRYGVDIRGGAVMQADILQIVGSDIGVYINGGRLICSELAVAGAFNGVFCENGASIETSKLFIQGTASSGLTLITGSSVDLTGDFITSGMAGNGMTLGNSATLRMGAGTVTFSGNGQRGIVTQDNATFVASGGTSGVSSGNVNDGVLGSSGSLATVATFDAIGNGGEGILILDGAGGQQISGIVTASNNAGEGIRVAEFGFLSLLSLVSDGNGSHGLLVDSGGAVRINNATIQNNTGRAMEAVYTGPCRLIAATINTSNAGSPQMRAVGGSVVQCPAPGAGGVSPSTVFEPAHGTLGATGQIFTNET